MTPTVSQTNSKINPLILGIMNENNALKLEILNHLIYLSTRFRSVFPSQGYLAAKFGVTPRWVGELLRRWKEQGVISYRQQGFNRSCIYHIHPLLNQEKNRIRFKLPAAALLLSIYALCSAISGDDFLLSNNKNLYIKKQTEQYRMVTVENAAYGFYEQQGPKETVFILNKQQSTSIGHQPLEGKSIMNKSVINQISDMYGLSVSEQHDLSNFSEEALQYAFNELKRQNKQNDLNKPVNWITKVAASYKGQSAAFPKTGRMNDYAKKIVNVTTNNNHSPSNEAPKTSKDERISFILREIANYEKQLAERSPWLKNVPGGEHLITIAQNAIANYKRELSELHYSPDDIQCESPRYFEENPAALEHRVGDREYEQHLDDISKDKTNPLAYKELVRKYDYHRTARRA